MTTTENEIWKDIPDYEGSYQVSNLGRVRSLDRVDSSGKRRKGKVLSLGHQSSGHLFVNLWLSNRVKIFRVHRLVLECFIGTCPEGMEGCHKDGNPINNKLINLKWDTRSGNFADKKTYGKFTSKYSGVCKNGKRYRAYVRHGKMKNIGTFDTEVQAAKAYDRYCKSNKLNKHLNFK